MKLSALSSPMNLLNIQNYGTNGYSKEFWIGIGVSVLTNLVQSFAMAFQRKSHLLNDKIYPVEARKHSLKRPMWVISFVVFLTANIIGSIFSIGYLPIVILAPIGALGLVFNALAAKIVLNDPFHRKTLIGTCLIVAGTLLVGLFGVIPEPDHDIDDLIRLYKKPAFIAYFSVLEFIIVTTAIATHYFEHIYNILESAVLPPPHIGKVLSRWIDLDDLKTYIGISYGMLAGNISSQSMLFAKSGLELIILTVIFDENQLQYALTWILLVMMVLTAILQLYYLNKGLRLCDTVILIPLSSCTFNVSCLFNGLVYYDQWDRLHWWQLSLVMLGVAITIGGVLKISWRSAPVNDLIQEEVAIIMPDDQGPSQNQDEENINIDRRPTEKTRLVTDYQNSRSYT